MEIQALIPLECEDDSSKLTSFANFFAPSVRLFVRPAGAGARIASPRAAGAAGRERGGRAGAQARAAAPEGVQPPRLRGARREGARAARPHPGLRPRRRRDRAHMGGHPRQPRARARGRGARALRMPGADGGTREPLARQMVRPRLRGGTGGLHAGSVEAVHGALLTTTELLGESGAPLSEAKLRDVFDLAWAHREHREKLVRRAVVALVPKLAEHCARSPHAGALFVQTYLSMTIAHLLNTLRTSSSDLREAAFLAIGDTAIATSRCPRRALLSSASVASGGGRSPDAGGPSADAPPLPRSPSPKAPKAATADEKAAKGVGWLLRGYNRSSAATPASLRPPVDYPPLSPRSSDGDGGSRVGRRHWRRTHSFRSSPACSAPPLKGHPFLPPLLGVAPIPSVRRRGAQRGEGEPHAVEEGAEQAGGVLRRGDRVRGKARRSARRGAGAAVRGPLSAPLLARPLGEASRSLVLMATHIPSQLHALQRRVLDAVCLVLARCPFSEWQRLSPHERAGRAAAASESHDDAAVAQQVTLALQTLGAFNEGDWSGQPQVLAFVHECASCFLDSDEVRFAPRAPPPPPAVPLVVVAPSPPSPRTTPHHPLPSPTPFICPRPPPRTRNSPLIRCTSAVLPPKGAVGYSCTLRSDPRRRKVRRVASPGAAATTSHPRRSLVAALPPRPPGVCSPRQSLEVRASAGRLLAARSATGEPPASWPGPPLPRLVEPAAAAAPDCASVRRACARKFCAEGAHRRRG